MPKQEVNGIIERLRLLGEALFYNNEADKALSIFIGLLALDPENVTTLNNIGVLLAARERYGEAEGYFIKALSIDGNDSSTLANLAQLSRLKHESAGCVQGSLSLIPHFDSDMAALIKEGERLFSEGDLDGALSVFGVVSLIDPNNFETWNNLGVTLDKKGQRERAIECLNISLSINPSFPDAIENLDSIKNTPKATVQVKPQGEVIDVVSLYARIQGAHNTAQLGNAAEAICKRKPERIASESGIDLIKFWDIGDWIQYTISTYGDRRALENAIAVELDKSKALAIEGYCEYCESQTYFSLTWSLGNKEALKPNFREQLLCGICGQNNRRRFTAGLVSRFIAGPGAKKPAVYMYEHQTLFFKRMKEKYPDMDIEGSEYFGPGRKSGELVGGIPHQDALALSFPDRSFDLLISNDIFEHVPDIEKALQEAHRVLKDGGRLLITIPLYGGMQSTVKRAALRNGEITYLLPPQYHGNPIDASGSLVMYDFGQDFLSFVARAGFRDAYLLSYYSVKYGYMGGSGSLPFFVAEK